MPMMVLQIVDGFALMVATKFTPVPYREKQEDIAILNSMLASGQTKVDLVQN